MSTTSEEIVTEDTSTHEVEWENSNMVLPMEIVEQIALNLADYGSRSAITASLIHPALHKSCLERMFTNGITAHIKKPSTLDSLVRRLSARNTPIHIQILRVKASSFCSLPEEENIKRVLSHLVDVEYRIDDLQLFLLNKIVLVDPIISEVRLPNVRSLSILHGPFPVQHIGFALNAEEVTLVEPTFLAVYALQYLPRLKSIYFFFIEDDEIEERGWWYSVIRRYALCSRRGLLDKLSNIKNLKADVIYFVVVDGDPHPDCFVQAIGHMHHDGVRHDFYRYWCTDDVNDFQRLDRGKDLIKRWERDHHRGR